MILTTELIRERLKKCHADENAMNKELSKLDWTIKDCNKKKIKLAAKISKNMKYRNLLINKL